ncbi:MULTISPECIES: hypothetical protein [Cocleimonas]|uniref:Uncharacterized protein n=1 Tax=Cocleimonas flava TaxID=634765 RepID=A0A4R1EY68_9GAMM|nr:MULTISPECIES: hypothetical protein [Cocleimonas]MEB8433347.1 hypothetical protein [Cocleimonas sp. KMM 6892]MEC4716158.1 hypothetical protein [Cocleimonas sp. KMM 6895]MEC4745949.1 hypothetical protein [Cocleimonas sp. KMM 6896]TCJ85002.1 hypothetical protein EV695_2967 [Cocleimonas flava]
MSSLIKHLISKFNRLNARNSFSGLEVHKNPFGTDQDLTIRTK